MPAGTPATVMETLLWENSSESETYCAFFAPFLYGKLGFSIPDFGLSIREGLHAQAILESLNCQTGGGV